MSESEAQIIVILGLTLAILFFLTWKDLHARQKELIRGVKALQTQINLNEQRLIQNDGILRTQMRQLENLVKVLPQDNQIDVLQAEISRLEDVRRALTEEYVLFTDPPPELPQYNAYWGRLSSWMREEKQWTCEKCGISLVGRQRDLHVHHIFGRGFNSPQHLKVLCRGCHAEEPDHEFMKNYPEYKAFLEWKRRLK